MARSYNVLHPMLSDQAQLENEDNIISHGQHDYSWAVYGQLADVSNALEDLRNWSSWEEISIGCSLAQWRASSSVTYTNQRFLPLASPTRLLISRLQRIEGFLGALHVCYSGTPSERFGRHGIMRRTLVYSVYHLRNVKIPQKLEYKPHASYHN